VHFIILSLLLQAISFLFNNNDRHLKYKTSCSTTIPFLSITITSCFDYNRHCLQHSTPCFDDNALQLHNNSSYLIINNLIVIGKS